MSVTRDPGTGGWRRGGHLLFSPALTDLGFVAGSTTRPLGNMGGSGTPAEDAARARASVAARLGFAEVVRVRQVHGSDVVYAPFDAAPAGAGEAGADHTRTPVADALWTDRPGVLLGVVAADCVPILVADDAGRIGAAHAGWQGTTRSVARRLVEAMRAAGADPARMVATLAPSIGPCCYAVGPDRVATIRELLGAAAEGALVERDGTVSFDLWTSNEEQLRAEGVARVESSRVCTKCGGADTWSRRAGDVGFNGLAFIGRRVSPS